MIEHIEMSNESEHRESQLRGIAAIQEVCQIQAQPTRTHSIDRRDLQYPWASNLKKYEGLDSVARGKNFFKLMVLQIFDEQMLNAILEEGRRF
jgi:hypothetical protein